MVGSSSTFIALDKPIKDYIQEQQNEQANKFYYNVAGENLSNYEIKKQLRGKCFVRFALLCPHFESLKTFAMPVQCSTN